MLLLPLLLKWHFQNISRRWIVPKYLFQESKLFEGIWIFNNVGKLVWDRKHVMGSDVCHDAECLKYCKWWGQHWNMIFYHLLMPRVWWILVHIDIGDKFLWTFFMLTLIMNSVHWTHVHITMTIILIILMMTMLPRVWWIFVHIAALQWESEQSMKRDCASGHMYDDIWAWWWWWW